MSLSALVLRLLLCLSLVVNGSGYAVAATSMQLSHLAAVQAHSVVVPVATAHEVAPPCHATNGLDVMPAMQHDNADRAATTDHHEGAACCEDGQCACDCLQHAPLAVSEPLHAIASTSAARGSRIPLGHAAPVLPHLIRPPIG